MAAIEDIDFEELMSYIKDKHISGMIHIMTVKAHLREQGTRWENLDEKEFFEILRIVNEHTGIVVITG